MMAMFVFFLSGKRIRIAAIHSVHHQQIRRINLLRELEGKLVAPDYGSAVRMDTNDSLRSASLWHSMHAISQHYRRLWVAQGSNSLKRIHSISVASNHSLETKEKEFIFQDSGNDSVIRFDSVEF
ncbi:hypothetical protein AAG906_006265 [Vitis piasezkii]